tara:strand:- start:45 stop:857 length:813 start_codon:yes stop_codon:yes gene_type:complete
MDKQISLLILAAGMGTRYGGLKQIEEIGPNGESLAELTAYDGLKYGCTKILFIIKEENEKIIREKFKKISEKIQTEFVIQKNPIKNRVKPLGTGQAVLCAKDHINEPFIVANADDYYGPKSINMLVNFLKENEQSAIVTFPLKKTLSTYGAVSRGICEINEKNNLTTIKETHGLKGPSEKKTPVSMNLWGFQPNVFEGLSESYKKFLDQLEDDNSEFLLPEFIEKKIKKENLQIKALHSNEEWCGVTYKEDLEHVRKKISKKFKEGKYPS